MRYIEAVRAQGENLRSSRAAVSDQLKALDLAPWRGRRLGLVGMGASANAIGATLTSYWAAGLSATAWLGSELGYAGASANFDAMIAVSQSGKSAEIVAALADLADLADLAAPATPAEPASACPRLVITDGPQSPAAQLADATVNLALLEDSNVRTVGYTGTLQALFLLAEALAGPGHPPAVDWDWLADEVDRQLPAAERLAADLLGALTDLRSFDVVGSGAQAGTAAQGALLLREVAKRPASAYETYQYLHGPIEAAGPGLGLLLTGGAREAKLAASLADTGAQILLITALEDVAPAAGVTVFRVPAGDDAVLATLGILPLQAISGALADAAGLPDGEFRFHQDDTKVD